jgi:DNA mismatch repair protein MutL
MSDIIHLLPDSVANQIAAGEVIQRPASVIKELVENAIDANAKHVHVLVTDAGKTSIQVIDDGKGMSETDARLSFERHATSKIKAAADLFELRTMGFRGEALASIAAVAQVTLKTRRPEDEVGTKLIISGSKIESQEATGCPVGSNFTVSNLFFNVPARRKFLKSNTTELSNILTEFERIALVHPDVAFSLYSNDSELFNLPVTNQRQRIMGIFGKKLNQQLLSVEVETTMVKISGFVGKPETARKKGYNQYFFVNGRYMRHPYFHKAVMEAYEHLIPTGEQVSYFIYFEVEPSSIDVNIHPTKTEIKFENEQAIWQITAAAVKEALGKFNAVPSIDFDTADMPDIPVFDTITESDAPVSSPPKVSYDEDFNPFLNASYANGGAGGTTTLTFGSKANGDSYRPSGESYKRPSANNWEKLYQGISHASKMNAPVEADYEPEREPDMAELPHNAEREPDYGVSPFQEEQPMSELPTSYPPQQQVIYQNEPSGASDFGSQYQQFKGRYILTSVKSGLMIIDQHRAHVRVLYDRYMMQIKQHQGMSQGVLFPEILQLPQSEVVVLHSINDDLTAIGFDISDLGGGSFAINGVPSGIEGLDPVELVKNMIHTATEKAIDVKEEVQSILSLTLAKASAIVYGQVLTDAEMVNLVDSLFACQSPSYTPDGKTILTTIKEEEIEKRFK